MRWGIWPFPHVAREGVPLIAGTGLLGVVLASTCFPGGRSVGILGMLLSVTLVYFYRDPDRPRIDTEDLLSPADGRVLEVAETQGEVGGCGRVVRLFLSILDVHVQRAPAAGTVLSIRRTPGGFLRANHPRAHLVNESVLVEVQTSHGRVAVQSIAGFVARRVVCRVDVGTVVASGDRIGMIHFGSQVDLHVPLEVEIQVRPGDRVTGGRTVIGRWPRMER
jgi:phosphatidylserine decarboxylase